MPAAYLVSAVDIKDWDTYKRDYVQKTYPTLVKAGAEILMVSDDHATIEGTSPGGRIVVMKFESREALMAWYDSAEYKEYRQVRHRTAETPFVLMVDAVDMSKAPPGPQAK